VGWALAEVGGTAIACVSLRGCASGESSRGCLVVQGRRFCQGESGKINYWPLTPALSPFGGGREPDAWVEASLDLRASFAVSGNDRPPNLPTSNGYGFRCSYEPRVRMAENWAMVQLRK
jgi:hypothetical protein